MKKNMGSLDRTIRVIAAMLMGLLLVLGVVPGVAGTILGILAVVLLATSVIGVCPLYLPFGFSTAKARQ